MIIESAGRAGGNNLVWSPLMLMSELTIGGKLPVGQPTGEIGWSENNGFYCITPYGLIGAPLMRNAVWQIDYGAQEITVAADVSQLDHIEGAIAIPFQIKENTASPTPSIELGVGDGTLTFVVDTGGGIPPTINTADLASAGVELPENAPKSNALAGGAAGAFGMQMTVSTLPIRFGDRELKVPVTVGDGMAPGFAGNMGHTFLKNFVTTFDWATQTIHLDLLFEGDTLPALPSPSAASIGFNSDGVYVSSIPQGGPADQAGLTLGETITTVDGKDVVGITQEEFCDLRETRASSITTEAKPTISPRLKASLTDNDRSDRNKGKVEWNENPAKLAGRVRRVRDLQPHHLRDLVRHGRELHEDDRGRQHFRERRSAFAFGALFLFAALRYLGWWGPVMREKTHGAPKWTMWIILLVVAGFIGINLVTTTWSAITVLLLAAGILVGFNEEALTRGILVVGWRGTTQSETMVWFFSSLLFGLLHLPNALFGLPLAGAVLQVFFAFMAGTGFYILRRASGTLLVPMIVHGAWDFA